MKEEKEKVKMKYQQCPYTCSSFNGAFSNFVDVSKRVRNARAKTLRNESSNSSREF